MKSYKNNMEINPLSRGFIVHLPGYKEYSSIVPELRAFALGFRLVLGTNMFGSEWGHRD